MLHNKVNIRLGKEDFDCTRLEGLYDCGCGDESYTHAAVGTMEEGEHSNRIDPVGVLLSRAAQNISQSHKITNEELIPG